MIERKIIIAMVVSTDFIKTIRPIWKHEYLESKTAQKIASWCIEYFDTYQQAPGANIETIYFEKLRTGDIGLSKETAEEIEEDILPGLSEEYANNDFNLNYLLDETGKYLEKRHLEALQATITDAVDVGDTLRAKEALNAFKWLNLKNEDSYLDLGKQESLKRVRKALNTVSKPIFQYPGAIGELLNSQLVEGSFIAFLASEKRGKTFWLLDMAMKAVNQRKNVAFFQAGDMTEAQQLKRICTYLLKKPDKEKYTGKRYIPVKDCVFNQLNTCNKPERECEFGVLLEGEWDAETIRGKLTKKHILDILDYEKDYQPCYNCADYKTHPWGSVWLKETKIPDTFTPKEGEMAIEKFFVKNKRQFRLSTHPNMSLSVKMIKQTLDDWKKNDNFVPHVIIVDYADILLPDVKMEFRHQQNHIWMALRGLSQEGPWMVITVTQADSKSYEQERLSLKNFSEDKRKYAHVTAMYGLNQDPKGREKELGLMWINTLVIREDEPSTEVAILQHLAIGRPMLTSFI